MPEPHTSDLLFNAAVLTEQRQPLILKRIRCSHPPQPGQVLVKLSYSGICGSQLGEIEGKKGADPYLPHLLGHEGCGTVLAVGPGVRRAKPNDKVVLHWMKAPGIQSTPPSYLDEDNQAINAGFVTTFNEYAWVSENRLTPIPSDFPDEVAALLGCALTTGLGIVQHDLSIPLGASVLVMGTGGVGLSVITGAALVGAYPIIALDQHADRLGLADQAGADITLDTRSLHNKDEKFGSQLTAQLSQWVGSDGFDFVIECTGNPTLIELAYKFTHPQGTCLLAGVAPKDKPTRFHTLELLLGKKLIGSFGGSARPDQDIQRYVKLIDADILQIESMLGERIQLSDINPALERMRRGETAGRTLIHFDH